MLKKKESKINFKMEEGKIKEFLLQWVDVKQKQSKDYGRNKYKMLIVNFLLG